MDYIFRVVQGENSRREVRDRRMKVCRETKKGI